MKFLKQKNGDGFTSIEHELAGQLADRLARHKALSDELAEKRAEAEAALAGRRGFLLSDNIADDKQRKAVDARVVAAQSAELGVEDALSVVAARINELRQQISEERNKAARAKAAKELHDRADALDRKLEVARISCVELSEVLDSMPALPLESVDFRSRVKTLLVEVPAAVAQFANDIRSTPKGSRRDKSRFQVSRSRSSNLLHRNWRRSSVAMRTCWSTASGARTAS
jgi:hypothetical protein